MIDLFSRKVVGWSMSSRMKAALVCDALKMALWQRKPKAGLIVHSDQGSQYASDAYNYLLNPNISYLKEIFSVFYVIIQLVET